MAAAEEYEESVQGEANGHVKFVDKRNQNLIIDKECRRIMRNLCSNQAGRDTFQQAGSATVTQPAFLTPEDRVIFFKTKMFYLLQERYCFLKPETSKPVRPAEAYMSFMSPFGETSSDQASISGKSQRQLSSEAQLNEQQGVQSADGKGANKATKKAIIMNAQKSGLTKFQDSIRKADQTALHVLDEKVRKTLEGTGYAALFRGEEAKKTDIMLSMFPDYCLLMQDGKDEESRLNNLMNHVRCRTKMFDKLQAFYENPDHDDHTAHVFTVPFSSVVEYSEVLAGFKAKRMHQLDEKKMQKLYSMFKDDYSSARTTLVADGTQPVVLNRKQLDRVKKYVEECADFKGTMMIPYIQETNFFFLSYPWTHDPPPTVG